MNPDSSDDLTPSGHSVADESNHPDPITGESGAHPIGVGVGAMGAGLAGAAIGAIAGPIGVLVGAAIGAVAGGLAGKEVAATDDEPVSLAERPVSMEAAADATLPAALPVSMAARSAPPSVGGEALATGADAAGSIEEETEGSAMPSPSIMGSPTGGVENSGGLFHEAFTTTTWQEAVAEDREGGSDDTAGGKSPAMESLPVGEGASAREFLAVGAENPEEEVRRGAYFRYLLREATGEPGDELGDWISAEHEVLKL